MLIYKYNNFPNDIQDKIDFYVKKNIKSYKEQFIFKELNAFHKRKLIRLIYKYYADFNFKNRFNYGFDGILNDIFFWLNHPYSLNMDTPFMSGNVTERFIKLVNKINPYAKIYLPFNDNGIYLNKKILKVFSTIKINPKMLVLKIFSNLTNSELEKLYFYNRTMIGKSKKNIIDISLRFNFKI